MTETAPVARFLTASTNLNIGASCRIIMNQESLLL